MEQVQILTDGYPELAVTYVGYCGHGEDTYGLISGAARGHLAP